MTFLPLEERPELTSQSKIQKRFNTLNQVWNEIQKKDVPPATLEKLNGFIEEFNRLDTNDKTLKKAITKTRTNLLTTLQKDLGITPKHYYRNLWMGLGMAIFGVPLGVMFGFSFGNMAYLGLGIPLGLAFGLAMGEQKDKKAAKEGKQLDVDIEM